MIRSQKTSAGDPSDRDLERRVSLFIRGRQIPALRHVEVSAIGGSVVLRGRLSSFYEKQLCLNCCQQVAGVRELIDQLDVVDRS